MGSDMAAVILAAAGGAVVTLLGVVLVTLVRRRNRSRADLEAMLLSAQHEADDLRARLEEVTARLDGDVERVPADQTPAFLITDVGGTRQSAVPAEDRIPVPDRLVLSATMGEPLVKVVAFGHGLRRALAPESRNRIWFEMRREVRAARKRRRQLLKQYQRDVRAAERAGEGLA